MKIARRYVLLQRIVWVQSLFCICLALYVLSSSKKMYPLNINVSESPSLDLSFLDSVTNFAQRAAFLPSEPLGAPVASGGTDGGGVSRRFPFRFDSYCVVDGRPAATVGGRVFYIGDILHGVTIDSISPLGVVVGGEWYDFSPHKTRELTHDSI